MKDYFNLTVEEKKELAAKRDFRPANFAKPTVVEDTTTETTTDNTITDEQ